MCSPTLKRLIGSFVPAIQSLYSFFGIASTNGSENLEQVVQPQLLKISGFSLYKTSQSISTYKPLPEIPDIKRAGLQGPLIKASNFYYSVSQKALCTLLPSLLTKHTFLSLAFKIALVSEYSSFLSSLAPTSVISSIGISCFLARNLRSCFKI